MLNILVPMAGRGSRFADAGYTLPKPLIDVDGHPMIELVIANLRPSRPHRFVFVARREHHERHRIGDLLRRRAPGCAVVLLDGVTEGAACTALAARPVLDMEDPLMIANSDQWVDASIDRYLEAFDASSADGFVMTMRDDDPKWSYVRFDDAERPVGIVEKVPVSDAATVGIYDFRRAADFVAAAEAMIAGGHRVNGEFYVAPVYDRLVEAGGSFDVFDVGDVRDGMHGLGTPEDLRRFCSSPAVDRARALLSRAAV